MRWLYEQALSDTARERERAMEKRREEEDVDGGNAAAGGGHGTAGASTAKRRERINQGINPAVAKHGNVAAPRND